MAYAERRERKKGVRYRGIYKAADGRYRSAGTFSTEKRALAVAEEAERHAAEVAGGAAGGLDPGTRATRTIKEYAPLFLRHHQVEGNTKDTYADTLRLHVIPFLGGCRLAETDRTVARNYITALQEAERSANTIRQAKVVLGAMFGMAVATVGAHDGVGRPVRKLWPWDVITDRYHSLGTRGDASLRSSPSGCGEASSLRTVSASWLAARDSSGLPKVASTGARMSSELARSGRNSSGRAAAGAPGRRRRLPGPRPAPPPATPAS